MRTAAASTISVLIAAVLAAQPPAPFTLDETTIADIHAAFRTGSLTCRSLVEQYLKRIDADDKQGAALNAIVMVNPQALEAADDLDRRFRQSGPVGALHCVPVIVKDNFETIEMPTTAGSLSLKGMMTGRDAFVVKRLRAAGAVMIAKSTWRSSPSARLKRSTRSCPATRAIPTIARASLPARAADRQPPPRRISAPSRSPATPATRSAARPRIRRWSDCARRWAW